jgi:hypothetical protein
MMKFDVFNDNKKIKIVWKSSSFSDITLCIPLKFNRRFGGPYRFHIQGWRISEAKHQREGGSKQWLHSSELWHPHYLRANHNGARRGLYRSAIKQVGVAVML